MSDAMLEKFLEALQPVAEKLGEGAEFIYGVAVRQVLISGAISLVWAVVFLTTAVVLGLTTKSLFTNEDRWKGFLDPEFVGLWSGAGTLITAALGVWQATSAIFKLLNPHWYAVGELLNQVGIGG